MSKKINICIPTPCQENWQDMTVADKGRFCAACQKHVIDFTTSSDRQIAESFKKEANLCGRFLHTQLHRDLVIPKEKSNIWMAVSAAVVAFVGLGNNQTFAQAPMEQSENKTDNSNKPSAPITHVISGVVTDSMALPIPGAYIKIKNSDKNATTDANGNFYIDAKVNDVIECSYITYKTESVIIENNLPLNIILKSDEKNPPLNITSYVTHTTHISGYTIIKETTTYTQNRSFFGRVFHSIGNIFR